MASANDVLTVLQEIETSTNAILETVAALDPAANLPVTLIEEIEKLATAALTAFTQASGTPITVESVQALLPNSTPLTAPKD
jgi:hypothetical protein